MNTKTRLFLLIVVAVLLSLSACAGTGQPIGRVNFETTPVARPTTTGPDVGATLAVITAADFGLSEFNFVLCGTTPHSKCELPQNEDEIRNLIISYWGPSHNLVVVVQGPHAPERLAVPADAARYYWADPDADIEGYAAWWNGILNELYPSGWAYKILRSNPVPTPTATPKR